ncbi:MAG: hypothetical protein GY778_04370, partial [bacterium]|nr:hypothetical protein [bacterium]
MSRIRNSAAAGLLALPLLCCLVGCAAGGGGSTGTTEQTGPSVSDAALAVCIPNCTDHNTDVSELYRRLDEYRGAGQTSEQAVDALMTDVAAAVGTAEAGTDRSEACRPCIETIAAEVYAPVDDDATGGGDGPGGSGTDTPGTPDGDDELEPGVPIAAPPVEFTADETTTASAMITAGAGGTVTAGGSMPARLEIPAGALASDREVSLTLCKAVD